MTEPSGQAVTSEAADQPVPTAGATGQKVATLNTAAVNIGQVVALRPSP